MFTDSVLPRDPVDSSKHIPLYIYVSKTGVINSMNAGSMSYSRNRAKGTNAFNNSLNLGNEAIEGLGNHRKLLAVKAKAMKAMFKTPFVPFIADNPRVNYMIPRLSESGAIANFRYIMAEHTRDTLFEKNNEYDTVLGSMAGQVVNKLSTPGINKDVIEALLELYNNEYEDRPALYVEIGPGSVNTWHREIYNLLPMTTKNDIHEIWGENRMFIPKDMVDLIFGTRKYSILEIFMKHPKERAFIEKLTVRFFQSVFGNKGVVRATQAEAVLIALTKIAKNNMIVKSFTTTINNYLSNIVFTRMNGVSHTNIMKWNREAMVGMLEYVKDSKSIGKNQILLTTNKARKPTASLSQETIDLESKRLTALINRSKNSIALNPVNEVMDAGMLQSIVDDIDTSHGQAVHLDVVEQLIKKITDRIPKSNNFDRLSKVGKVAFMTEDTQLYKAVNNAVKMTDFVGRYIMYKHYTLLPEGEGRLTHAQAISKVRAQFVNFDVPSNRMLDYFNSTGFLWFTKYAFGILKPIKDVIQEKPFEAITALFLARYFGMPSIGNAIPFIGKNPVNLLGTAPTTYHDAADDILTINVAEELYSKLF
jgi:hypothetical protein